MDLGSRKLAFIEEFVQLKSEKVLSQLEQLLKKGSSSDHLSNSPVTMTQEELDQRISKAEKDFDNNRYKSSAQLEKKYRL